MPEQNTPTRTDLVEEAYVYAFPILMSYKTMYQYSIDSTGSNFKAPFNELLNTHRVYGPQDTTVVTANSDTPYSLLWTDLRAEPIVLTFPKIESNRYFVAQSQELTSVDPNSWNCAVSPLCLPPTPVQLGAARIVIGGR